MEKRFLTIVMYHYIRDFDSTFPDLKGETINAFKQQVVWLMKNFEPVDLDDIIEYVAGNKKHFPQNSFMLSFDDGLREHFTTVFPLLRTWGLAAVFSPITETLINREKINYTHKIHLLLAKYETRILVDRFHQFIQKNYPQKISELSIDDSKLKYERPFGDILTLNFKGTLQTMDKNIRDQFLNNIFNELVGEERDIADQFYFDAKHLREMSKAGMIISSHSHTHRQFPLLSSTEQFYEINKSKMILQDILGEKMEYFTYPFGKQNMETRIILQKLGFRAALGTQFQKNVLDKNFDILNFKRIDPQNLLK